MAAINSSGVRGGSTRHLAQRFEVDGDDALALQEVREAEFGLDPLTLELLEGFFVAPETGHHALALDVGRVQDLRGPAHDLVGGFGGAPRRQDPCRQIGDRAFVDVVDRELCSPRLVDEGRQGVDVEHDGIAGPAEGAQFVGVAKVVPVTLGDHGMHLDLVTMDERPDRVDQDVVRRTGVDDGQARMQRQGDDCVGFDPEFDDAHELIPPCVSFSAG